MKRNIWLTNPTKHFRPRTFQELRDGTKLYWANDISYWNWLPVIRILNAYLINWEIIPMPPRNTTNLNDWQFVNINISSAEAEKFSNWYLENEDNLWSMLTDVIAQDYKLSLSFDAENVCFIATLSGVRNNNVNPQSSMSARSSEDLEAVALLLYKHLVICENGNWAEHSRPANWG